MKQYKIYDNVKKKKEQVVRGITWSIEYHSQWLFHRVFISGIIHSSLMLIYVYRSNSKPLSLSLSRFFSPSKISIINVLYFIKN